MSCSVLHHIEVCVKNDGIIDHLTKGFGFVPFAQRITSTSSKLALRSKNSVFVVIKRLPHKLANRNQNISNGNQTQITTPSGEVNLGNASKDQSDQFDDYTEHWTVFCCKNMQSHCRDSVFNVALVVKDVDAVTKRAKSNGGQVLRKPANLLDSKGVVRYSIVTSPCGNFVHTLIDKSKYRGTFLPGFENIHVDDHEGKFSISGDLIKDFNGSAESPNYIDSSNLWGYIPNKIENLQINKLENSLSFPISTHFDHVAYVCNVGESSDLLSWYESCFGMKRFMTNRSESKSEGFVLGDNIGLRLKAMEYWMCAESGLVNPHDGRDESFKLVVVEPLPEVSTSHVASFLKAHGGPGIQHIALHTPTMVATVDHMARNGVDFRKAPLMYYKQGMKLEEIVEAGHENEIERFQELGILLDAETDVFTEHERERNGTSYLLQVFTKPLFEVEDSFFLEIIQRRGARGFGAGNISALAKSLLLENEDAD